jgi:hypothetical protein
MDRGFKNYIEATQSDIASLVYLDGDGASFEDKFTEHCIEILDNIGKSEGARVLSYINADSLERIDWKINRFAFEESNPLLFFLNDLETFEAIEAWVTRLTSRIVMKYDEVFEPINDFIYDFIVLG